MDILPCGGLCDEAFGYCEGYEGKNADKTKILFVLNCADSRVLQTDLFDSNYRTALFKSATGVILSEILKRCELSEEDAYITNLYKCLLPKDREPNARDYKNCVSVLEKQIEEFEPRKLILFGEKNYRYVFPGLANPRNLSQVSSKEPFDFKTTRGRTVEYDNRLSALISLHPGMIFKLSHEDREQHYAPVQEYLKDDS